MRSGGFLLLVGLLAFWAELRLISAVPPPAPCHLPADVGPCKAFKVRYFYNPASNRCETFIYGGCKGNKNNFETLEQCQKTCVVGKPGLCPKPPKDIITTCDVKCKSDKACPKDQKCCPYGCTIQCSNPI
ncbi:protease inhibitor 4-like [Elgaria multicarinata webbii]|uniref:protease inhibitor 4-like n=1 Tax=Elgaria multicarinata webbii TaxID=159646 RepID=UPI002FCD6A90